MATEKLPLWGDMKVPIIVLSGEVNSGKSLFPITIDPVCRLPKDEAEPTTIVFDQEGSAETYHGSLNFKWFDTRAAVFDGLHRKTTSPGGNDPKWLRILKAQADVNDSPQASMFRAAYLAMMLIEPDKYRVMAFDTFTPIQEGLIAWLRMHPEAFGRTASQYEKASSMFLWPDVKSMLSHILAVDCRLRFESTILTVHMKSKWEGERKTKERMAEGLDVLDKLATLHIRLERTADAKGNVPRTPVGILVKERLVRFGATPANDQPILPPRIEHCTPDTIRQWIQAPADYGKLKASERVPEKPVTEIELQQMKLATAEAEAEAANARAALLDRQRELLSIRNQQPAQRPTPDVRTFANTEPKPRDEVAEAAAEAHRKSLAAEAEGRRLAAAAPPEHQRCAPDNGRVERFKLLAVESGIDHGKLKAAMAARGAERFSQLGEADQDSLLTALQNAADKRKAASAEASAKN